MRVRALALVTLALAGCEGCDEQPASPDLGGGAGSAAAVEPSPASIRGRAAAHQRALPEARERATRRATLLADGRRLARARQHAEALRALEDALRETEGPDAALHCEAGHEAIQLGQWPLARRHLLAGLAVAVQPRRRAACLNDLALVEEAVQDRTAAIAALRQSLTLRPHGAVERKLRALEAAAGANASLGDEEGSDGEATAETYESFEALCAAPCRRGSAELPSLPEGWPELAFAIRPADAFHETTWLVAKEGGRWREVAAVASTDLRDVFGALEAREAIAGTRMEAGRLVVAIAGAFDEPPGAGDAYFACERQHREDDGARLTCFEATVAELPPAESWSYELVFEEARGRLRLADRRPGPETQIAR